MAFVLLAAFIVIGLLFALTSGSHMPNNEVKVPDVDSSYSSIMKHQKAFFLDSIVEDVQSNSLVTSTEGDCSPELLAYESTSEICDITMD